LASFEPINLRKEKYKDDGSLQDSSVAAESEIIRRVISRFFRSEGSARGERGRGKKRINGWDGNSIKQKPRLKALKQLPKPF
jgi:hypothetical protein